MTTKLIVIVGICIATVVGMGGKGRAASTALVLGVSLSKNRPVVAGHADCDCLYAFEFLRI